MRQDLINTCLDIGFGLGLVEAVERGGNEKEDDDDESGKGNRKTKENTIKLQLVSKIFLGDSVDRS